MRRRRGGSRSTTSIRSATRGSPWADGRARSLEPYVHLWLEDGLDATRKLPEEGFTREWPAVIEMDEATKRKVDAMWPRLALGARSVDDDCELATPTWAQGRPDRCHARSRWLGYVNFVKLPHTVFALPFALVGVVLASYRQRVHRR
jgi:hypothetical protein